MAALILKILLLLLLVQGLVKFIVFFFVGYDFRRRRLDKSYDPGSGIFPPVLGSLAAGEIARAAGFAHQDDVVRNTGFSEKALEGNFVYGHAVCLGDL
jgi:hypothetical protein